MTKKVKLKKEKKLTGRFNVNVDLLSDENREKLKKLGALEHLKTGTYSRIVLLKHIAENEYKLNQ